MEEPGTYKVKMKYNCSIRNESALPLPYSLLKGKDDISVGSLYKDKPLLVWLNYITGSNDGQCFRFNCSINDKPAILILPVDSELVIQFTEELKQPLPK